MSWVFFRITKFYDILKYKSNNTVQLSLKLRTSELCLKFSNLLEDVCDIYSFRGAKAGNALVPVTKCSECRSHVLSRLGSP